MEAVEAGGREAAGGEAYRVDVLGSGSRGSRGTSVASCDIVVRGLSSCSLAPLLATAARRHRRCNVLIGVKRGPRRRRCR